MLIRLLKSVFAMVSAWCREARQRPARALLGKAVRAYLAGDLEVAKAKSDLALRQAPALSDAWYWCGIFACVDGDCGKSLSCLGQALKLAPDNPPYLAAMGDAFLLQKREEEALNYYQRAMPEYADVVARADSAGLPYRKAHPAWLKHISSVRMPRPHTTWTKLDPLPAVRLVDIASTCYSNYAALLANRFRATAAISLFERAVKEDPESGYPHAALALIHTLNQNWAAVIPEARAAKRLGAHLFSECNDFCLLAAALGLGKQPGDLDEYLDWKPIIDETSDPRSFLDLLPRVEQSSFVMPRRYPLVFFIACDAVYFREHAVALIWSIRDHSPSAAVHVHFFAPESAVASDFENLRYRTAPLDLYATFEDVDFDRYGGKAVYCICARFCRLYQWLLVNQDRVAMIDADSLVRGDIVSALAGRADIALVCAKDEPIWHHYLGCFSGAFQPSPASRRFLAKISAVLAANLALGRMPWGADQIALYVCTHVLRAELGDAFENLPLVFCDTLFGNEALMWSITTKEKETFGRYLELKQAILARNGQLA